MVSGNCKSQWSLFVPRHGGGIPPVYMTNTDSFFRQFVFKVAQPLVHLFFLNSLFRMQPSSISMPSEVFDDGNLDKSQELLRIQNTHSHK